MPIKIPNKLPAASVLERENIFFMDADRAYGQDIRPLRLCILNLMPVKSVTETQLLRLLGNSPLQVEVDFIYTESYLPQHTSQEYLTEFYGTFAEVRNRKYDGFLMTGAPVEQMPFEDVAYWDEVCEIMEWSKTHAFSSFYICWGAQAGLYYHYGIPSTPYPRKSSASSPTISASHTKNSFGVLTTNFTSPTPAIPKCAAPTSPASPRSPSWPKPKRRQTSTAWPT